MKLPNFEVVVRLMELVQMAIADGYSIKGKTKEELENWTFTQCPKCKNWTDQEVCCEDGE